MPSFKFKNVVISHPELKSKNATFVALLNEVIYWGETNGLTGQQMTHFVEGFQRPIPKVNRKV